MISYSKTIHGIANCILKYKITSVNTIVQLVDVTIISTKHDTGNTSSVHHPNMCAQNCFFRNSMLF